MDATRKIDKPQAAIDRKTKGTAKKPYEPQPGERWITTPRLKNKTLGWPTFSDYIEQEAKKNPPEH